MIYNISNSNEAINLNKLVTFIIVSFYTLVTYSQCVKVSSTKFTTSFKCSVKGATKCEGDMSKVYRYGNTYGSYQATGEWKYYKYDKLIAKGRYLSRSQLSIKCSKNKYGSYPTKTHRIGTWEYFYDEGNIKKVEYYSEKGQKTGEWTAYYHNGNIKEVGHYKNDKKEGQWIEYEKNRDFQIGNYKPDYKSSYKDGTWKHFYDTGKLKKVINWENGNQIDITSSYINDIITKINVSNYSILESFEKQKNATIKETLAKVTKGEYEKEATFKERFNKIKTQTEKKYNNNYYSLNYVLNRFTPLFYEPIIDYAYDSENHVLQLKYNNVEPFLIKLPKSEVRQFTSKTNRLKFKNLTIDVTNENNFKILSGGVIDESGNTYIINNSLIFNNSDSIQKEASKILKKITNTVITPKVEFYNNANEKELFVSKNSSYLIDYVEKYEKKINKRRESIIRSKKEFESLDDYKKAISLDKITTSFSPLTLYTVFEKYNQNFDLMKYDSQEYNAEDEVFKITYNDYGTLYIKVPIANAESFGTALKNRQLKPLTWPNFVFLDENTIAMSSLTFKNFKSHYKASDSISFENNNFHLLSKASKTPIDIKPILEKIKKEKIEEERKIKIKKVKESLERKLQQERNKAEIERLRKKEEKKRLNFEKAHLKYVGEYQGKLKGIQFKYYIKIKGTKLYWEDDKGSKPSYIVNKDGYFIFENHGNGSNQKLEFQLNKNVLIHYIGGKKIKLRKNLSY